MPRYNSRYLANDYAYNKGVEIIKKIFALVLLIVGLLCILGCGNQSAVEKNKTPFTTVIEGVDTKFEMGMPVEHKWDAMLLPLSPTQSLGVRKSEIRMYRGKNDYGINFIMIQNISLNASVIKSFSADEKKDFYNAAYNSLIYKQLDDMTKIPDLKILDQKIKERKINDSECIDMNVVVLDQGKENSMDVFVVKNEKEIWAASFVYEKSNTKSAEFAEIMKSTIKVK